MKIAAHVRRALMDKRPIVALESTIVAHGMPYPQNLNMSLQVEELIKERDVVPATIAILNGEIHVGLTQVQLETLATIGTKAKKCATRDIAVAMAQNLTAATTVSSTMHIAHQAGISVFVTGGIGGVHRGAAEVMDISADLIELSRTPVAVVCAGVKSILDIGNTLEYLETHSVPVIGYGTTEFPAFFTQASGYQAQIRCDTGKQVADIIHANKQVNLKNGLVVAVPNPNPVPQQQIDRAIQGALIEAKETGLMGNAVTPFLLKRVNELTGGDSLQSNIDLVKENALVGCQIATALTGTTSRGQRKSSSTADVVVFGGLVQDIIAYGSNPGGNIHHTSNIGHVKHFWGGVARNVAEALHRLGNAPLLVSAVGEDTVGKALIQYCTDTGMSTTGIQCVSDTSSAVYTAVLSKEGELDVAIADMGIFDALDVCNSKALSAVERSKMVVFDGNLSPTAMNTLLQHCVSLNIPTWFEPTSCEKAIRPIQANCFSLLTYISPSTDELYAISNTFEPHSDDPHEFDLNLVEKHVNQVLKGMFSPENDIKHVIVTLGRHGVAHGCGKDENDVIFSHFSATKVNAKKNCTGAGDSLAAGTIHGILDGKDMEKSIKMGMMAARKSLLAEEAIHPDLSRTDLFE